MLVVEFEMSGQRFSEPLGRNLSDQEILVAKKLLRDVPDLKPALLPRRKVQRSFLHAHQVVAMLDAGKRMEERHRRLDAEHIRYIRQSVEVRGRARARIARLGRRDQANPTWRSPAPTESQRHRAPLCAGDACSRRPARQGALLV
jgi:hypothetical protein